MKTDDLRKNLGNLTVLEKAAERETYSHDIGDIPPVLTKMMFKILPDFVVQPKSIDDIVNVIKTANTMKVPVIPRGAASWGFGGVIPTKGGIVIDLSPFRKVLKIDKAQKTATVEAGARWADIDIYARKQGLCLMTYPSSKFSSIGGWIATGGYAINSYKYGHLSKQIESITVVTGSGEVKKLTPADKEYKYYFETEGQVGIVAEVVLKLRDIPKGSFPHLLYFPGNKEAFAFMDKFVKDPATEKYKPNTIRFLDATHIEDINKLMHTGIFKKNAAVVFEFGSIEDDKAFTQYLAKTGGIEEAPNYVANYIWNERLFGMKIKRLGPTILASEVIIPITSAAAFIAKAKKLGVHFGVEIAIDCYIIDSQKALIMCNYLCDSRKMKYYINVPFVAILTRAAVGSGAEPYGLGLWNSGFINYMYNKEKRREFMDYKARVDPNNVLNPGKPFSRGGKGLSGLLFSPFVFGVLIQLLIGVSPAAGGLVRLVFGKNKKLDSLDIELSTHACAKCGNCLAVCPAYLVTGNEADTAKGKIAIARKLQAGQTLTKEEANAAFQCMHCRACEEICQTNLELMELWEVLEKKLEAKFGRPAAQVEDFLKKVDASQEYWDMVERNS
jgi:FAD/FMN-containing dehydrogenase/NAD-dependent dihydropyrimidine dehydrogenase PreA subunit